MHTPLWTIVLLHAVQNNALSIHRPEHRTEEGYLSVRTNAANICLPPQLQAAVPDCALTCLQTFVLINYPNHTCSSTADLDVLCTSSTSSGLTIGEGSLQCVISNCLGADIETQSGYTVCDGIAGAQPNMAGTITATINAVTTLATSVQSLTSNTNTVPTTTLTESLASTIQSAGSTSVLSPSTVVSTLTSISLSQTTSTPVSPTVSSPSPSVSSNTATSTSGSTASTSLSSIVDSSSSTTHSTHSTTATTTSSIQSATAAAASAGVQKQILSTSAIAGIATASVIVVAFLFGYLAYLLVVKRKEKQKRRSQRFSTWFPPHTGNGTAGSAPPAVAQLHQNSLATPSRRFYAGEPAQQNRRSFWRKSYVPPSDIGVAVAASTRVSPERRKEVLSNANRTLRQSYDELNRAARPLPVHEDRRWSIATSFDEDVEAHNQDVPILGSPKARSSARSFTSVGKVEKSTRSWTGKVKPRASSPQSARIPLTPVYDNGIFEPTLRHVFDEEPMPIDNMAAVSQSHASQAPNFSRWQPSLTRTSETVPRPPTIQPRQQNPTGRFPVKPTVVNRKQSERSNQTVSVHTEFEEDDTPDQEEDKQLGKSYTTKSSGGRRPLRDLEWPQIPRPAAQAKQAGKVHSPRAAVTLRRDDFVNNTTPKPPGLTRRAQLVKDGRSFVVTDTSSTPDIVSQGSSSPIFPTPPAKGHTIAKSDTDLARQILNAYGVASETTTKSVLAQYGDENSVSQCEQPIPRLGTGRPLAQRLQAQGYTTRASNFKTSSRAQVMPMTSRSRDLYLAVGGADH